MKINKTQTFKAASLNQKTEPKKKPEKLFKEKKRVTEFMQKGKALLGAGHLATISNKKPQGFQNVKQAALRTFKKPNIKVG